MKSLSPSDEEKRRFNDLRPILNSIIRNHEKILK